METKEYERQRRSSAANTRPTGTSRVNFWQLDLEGPSHQIEPAFDAETSEKLSRRMNEIAARKKDAFSVYNDKVGLADYHCFVEFDMYF